MNKIEAKRLLNLIKGYYNTQFFVDESVIQVWQTELEPYDLEDAEDRLKSYLKEFPDIPPKPHTFIKGMLTIEQKKKRDDFIICCQKAMPLSEFDPHYGRCLDIEYLVGVAKRRGENIKRKDLEEYNQETIDKLIKKYEPKEMWCPKCMK